MQAIWLIFCLGCGDSNWSDQALKRDAVCGSDSLPDVTSKIVGGQECRSSNGTVVKLLLFDEEDNQTICSGVRLNSTTILTAAHCFNEFVFSVLVELASGQRIAPIKVVRHPEATDLGTLYINDLALVTIASPAGEIPPPIVPLAEDIALGATLIIFGYGVTDGTSQVGSGVLRFGEMQVDRVTTDSIFSAYSPPTTSNTCFGDSGGPAFIENKSGGLALAGITSTGINERCAVGDQSAFTNLTNQALRAFIEGEMIP